MKTGESGYPTSGGRSFERKEAHPELDQPFDEAMVLLDTIVEVFTLS
jgi:hypothetical protein